MAGADAIRARREGLAPLRLKLQHREGVGLPLFPRREGAEFPLRPGFPDGETGNAGQANYAASKAGLIGFTKSLAQEFAPRKVTCNAIAPGFISTEMSNAIPDNLKEEIVKKIPLKEQGSVEDIAALTAFLASDDARYITGQVIACDGGMTM